jgi:hypothetical protein
LTKINAADKAPADIGVLSVEEALNSVGSSPQGLSGAEARRRRREYGPNRIEKIAQ